jgi:hypothetical protein
MDDRRQGETYATDATDAVAAAVKRNRMVIGTLEFAIVYALLANYHELRNISTIARSNIQDVDPAVEAVKALSIQMEAHTVAMHRLATEMEKLTQLRADDL